jgi:hypothetical protein
MGCAPKEKEKGAGARWRSAAPCGVPWWFAWMRIETMPDSTGIRVA